jgi:hypothetical protein
MSSSLLYHEIIDQFNNTQKRSEKISVLQKHSDKNFITFLQYAFDPSIVFDVEIPNYRPSVNPAGLNETYLHNEVQKMYRFIKDHPKRPNGLTPQKQKNLLTVVLESLHKEEADLFVRCLKKDLKVPFLTPKLILEAFPNTDFGQK